METLGLNTLVRDLGFPVPRIPRVMCDSSSALAVCGRRGPSSRLKHIQLRELVCQDWQRQGRLSYQKVESKNNLADFLTKYAALDAFHMGVAGVGLGTSSS